MFKKAKNVVTTGVTVIGTVTDVALKAAEALPAVMDATGSALSKGGALASQLASSYAGDLEDFIDARESEATDRKAMREANAKVRAAVSARDILRLELEAKSIDATTVTIEAKSVETAKIVEAKSAVSLARSKLTAAEAQSKAFNMAYLISKAKGNTEIAAKQLEAKEQCDAIAKALRSALGKPKPKAKPETATAANPEAESETEPADIQPDFSNEDGSSNRFGM